MNFQDLPAVTAFTLGLVTSISPCPLATNVAATAFVTRRYKALGWVLSDTASYAIGRAFAYTALALLIRVLSLKVARVANPLMTVAEIALGPVLLLIGLIILDVIPLPFGGAGIQDKAVALSGKIPIVSSFLLGIGFAMAFCPFSGSLYFGGLIPLTLASPAGFLLAVLYGIGTALPVLVVGLLLALSLKGAERVIAGLQKLDRWVRPAAGVIFIGVGVYESGRWILSRI